MHPPNIVLNWPAILVSVLAAFFMGFLWYGPLFGKLWAKEMGMSMDKKPDPKVMMKAFGLHLLGTFLTAYILAHDAQVWRQSVWGLGQDPVPNTTYGFYCGFFVWTGFYVPMQLNKVAWEMRSWKLFLINVSHDFVILQAISQILANWR